MVCAAVTLVLAVISLTREQASLGNDTIFYSYTDTLTGCSNVTYVVVFVSPSPTISVVSSTDTACPGQTVVFTPIPGNNVTNIIWSNINGTVIGGGLNSITTTANPPGTNFCIIAQAISNNGCTTNDTSCISVLQPAVVAVNDSVTVCDRNTINIHVLNNDYTTACNATFGVSQILTAGITGSASLDTGIVHYVPALFKYRLYGYIPIYRYN